MQTPYISIDGSYGEGGGQILRSAIALSILLSKPIEIINIRKDRPKSGLQPQHLLCVNASRDISNALVVGNEIGSSYLRFSPREIRSGRYTFDVAEKKGSAGSTSLVLQTLLLPLCLGSDIAEVTLKGGTHVPWSPPFHYLKDIFLPLLKEMGVSAEISIEKWGWYPTGGGIVHVRTSPIIKHKESALYRFNKEVVSAMKGITIEERGVLRRIRGISAVSNLPISIAERQRKEGFQKLMKLNVDMEIDVISAPSPGRGTFFFIEAEYDHIRVGFSSLGALKKTAEEVARESCHEFLEYHKSIGAIEPHLSDQLLPYIALAEGRSIFTTTKITKHLLTNIWTIQKFMKRDIRVDGRLGEKGKVTCN